MSGHSKWATIKRKKAANDAKRGRLFAKLIRAIEVAARQGGPDPDNNPTLASAIAKAKSSGVPADNIERALARASGQTDADAYEDIWYEGYAPGGVALYIHVLTDNRNRAASDVRTVVTRGGGNLGEPGSVAYLFDQKGYLLARGDEETVMLAAIEGGAEDVKPSGDAFEVICEPGDLEEVRRRLTDAGVEVDTAEVTRLPKTTVPIDGESATRVLRLIDALEELDDVQEVFANFDVSDELMEAMAGS
jgi:YebC/PmpR family DNA-binding regulatory protein